MSYDAEDENEKCPECGEEYIDGIYCRCDEQWFFGHDGKGY